MSDAFTENSSLADDPGLGSAWGGLEPVRPAPRFAVDRVRTLASWRHAQALLGRRYGQRGLKLKEPVCPDTGLATLRVREGDKVVGTLSVRLDSERGLSADTVFPEEMKALREGGQRLCEFTRLAVEGDTESKQVLARLFHLAYLYAYRLERYDLLTFEVHPRHAPFYKRMLGAKLVANERMNMLVNAPAVLMCLPLREAERQIELYAGRPEMSSQVRTIYPLFYSASEENAVLRELSSEL